MAGFQVWGFPRPEMAMEGSNESFSLCVRNGVTSVPHVGE